MNWASRHHKALMRDYLMGGAKTYHHAVFMPGWDEEANVGCLCIARALEIGAIDHNTKIIAVERRTDIAERIRSRLNSFGFVTPPLFHRGELCDLQFAADDQIDFAMLDFLGTLDQPLAVWMRDSLAQHLTPHATIGITLTHTYRNNYFMIDCAYAWKTNPSWRSMALQYAGQFGITDDAILLHLVILRSVLADFNYTYRRVQRYRDTRRIMLAYRMDDFMRADQNHWPKIEELLASIGDTVCV